jgi:hypothetical protein
VVFLEQPARLGTPGVLYGIREDRFWQSYTGDVNQAYTPRAVVDSGHVISNGAVDFPTLYKYMVDHEPSTVWVDLQAYAVREGDSVRVYTQAKNLSGSTFSSANSATAWVLIYEDVVPVPGANLTSRFVRVAVSQPLSSPLAGGAGLTYSMAATPTANRACKMVGSVSMCQDPNWVDSMDWTKLHAVVLLEYRPGGNTGRYDMLQAAVVPLGIVGFAPGQTSFWLDANTGSSGQATAALSGPPFAAWSVESDQPWLSAAVVAPGQVKISVDMTGRSFGSYTGTVTATSSLSDGTELKQSEPVIVSYAAAHFYTYVPAVTRRH